MVNCQFSIFNYRYNASGRIRRYLLTDNKAHRVVISTPATSTAAATSPITLAVTTPARPGSAVTSPQTSPSRNCATGKAAG